MADGSLLAAQVDLGARAVRDIDYLDELLHAKGLLTAHESGPAHEAAINQEN